jgi:hypothetical protein
VRLGREAAPRAPEEAGLRLAEGWGAGRALAGAGRAEARGAGRAAGRERAGARLGLGRALGAERTGERDAEGRAPPEDLAVGLEVPAGARAAEGRLAAGDRPVDRAAEGALRAVGRGAARDAPDAAEDGRALVDGLTDERPLEPDRGAAADGRPVDDGRTFALARADGREPAEPSLGPTRPDGVARVGPVVGRSEPRRAVGATRADGRLGLEVTVGLRGAAVPRAGAALSPDAAPRVGETRAVPRAVEGLRVPARSGVGRMVGDTVVEGRRLAVDATDVRGPSL